MYLKKHLIAFFAVIFVYCIWFCESGKNEIYRNDALELSSLATESLFLTYGDISVLSFKDETHRSDDINECKCKNGRCETSCGEWKNGACYKTKQVCICDPEFGKFNDQTCIYCNCGKGFNCTVDLKSRGDVRKCSCPEGYYDYSGKCAKLCNAQRPCLNGGKCQEGKCKCMSGTHGPFCEGIFWCAYECRSRLTVDCVYNQETENYGCQCKNQSLVYDYHDRLCKPCPCGEGTCKEERHELRCDCKAGYKEFDRQCKKCDCGPDHDCELHWKTGEKICKCRKGFFSREGTCLPCECGHKEATCQLDNVNRKICNCPEGYEYNLGLCQKIEVNCTCHPTAKCIKRDEKFTCACEDGYIGRDHDIPKPGEPCIDIDECDDGTKCPKWTRQRCINFPGSFMCQCETDFRPVGGTDEFGKITCEKYEVSWLPTGITIGIIIVFITVSIGFIKYLKQRESSAAAPGLELRGSR